MSRESPDAKWTRRVRLDTIHTKSVTEIDPAFPVFRDRLDLGRGQPVGGAVRAKHGPFHSGVINASYSTTTGGNKETYYRLQAALTSGKAITVADSLRGRAAAQQLLSSLCRQTGYAKGSLPG